MWANVASGGRLSSASYKLTEDALLFAAGLVSSHEEALPLWAVRDVDLHPSMTQRARGVADLTLKVDDAAAHACGQAVLVMKSVHDAKKVQELILDHANQVRSYWNQRRHDTDIERQRAGATNIVASAPSTAGPAASTGSGDDFTAKMSKLTEMKLQGVLTDDEFAAAKARLIAS